MKSFNNKTWLVTFLAVVLSQSVTAVERIDPQMDLTYLGAFRPPANFPYDSGEIGNGLTFYPDGNGGQGSLFILHSGQATGYRHTAEISIPIPIISKSISSLNYAQQIQPLTNITNIESDPGVDSFGDVLFIPKQGSQTTDKIYWTAYMYYGASAADYKSLGQADINFSSPNPVGLWHIGADRVNHTNRVGKYIFEADHAWSDTYTGGRYILVGRHRQEGQGGSSGPTLYAVAPQQVGNPPQAGSNLPDITLMEYESDFQYPNYSKSDNWNDGIWIKIGNKQAIIFAGRKAGSDCYGEASNCNNDPCSMAKGDHGQPFTHLMSWYDINDFTKVIQGQLSPKRVLPYSEWTPTSVMLNTDICTPGFGGVAYDEVKRKLYVVEKGAAKVGNYGIHPVIHVFEVKDSGGGSTTLSPPSSLKIVQ